MLILCEYRLTSLRNTLQSQLFSSRGLYLQSAHGNFVHRVGPPRYPHRHDQSELRRKETDKDVYPRTMSQRTNLDDERANSAETATIPIL